jgi:bifunctional DNase/RNase
MDSPLAGLRACGEHSPHCPRLEEPVVEMCVRYVRRHVPSGNDVAVLGPATAAERPLIALTVTRPEALELSEELQQRPTARGGVYDLLVSILGSAGTSVASIEVLEADGQNARARLKLDGPRGPSQIEVEVGQAVSLSVRIGKPLQVSERLIEAVTPPAAARGESPADEAPATDAAERSTPVPDEFRRAFDRQERD